MIITGGGGGEVAGDIFTLLSVLLERMASGAMGTEQLASESVLNVMRLSVTHNGIKDQLFAHQLTLPNPLSISCSSSEWGE